MKAFAVCFNGEARKGSIFATAIFVHRDDAEEHCEKLNYMVGVTDNGEKTYFVRPVTASPDFWIVA